MPAHVEGEHHQGLFGNAGAASELRVMVPASQLERARQLTGLAVGVIHMYADRFNEGLALLLVWAVGLAIVIGGEWLGVILMVMVYLYERFHGIPLLEQHDRELEALAMAKEEPDTRS